MKLWLISQDTNNRYDTYDSAVVIAESEDDARRTHPGGIDIPVGYEMYPTWVSDPALVTVEMIGDALPDAKAGVVCRSFNAG